MSRQRRGTSGRLKAIFYACVLLVVTLVGYRTWLAFFEPDFSSVHARQIETIQGALADREALSFAVVGNIDNSVGIFERQMIPMINAAEPDFLVSTGNAVSGGGEDKYRALYRTLGHLEMPWLLTVGENESSLLGAIHFRDHFGPGFFSFEAGNSQFLFLDSTDVESFPFQTIWLRERLEEPGPRHRFVFISEPLLPPTREPPMELNRERLLTPDFRRRVLELLRRHSVTAVFSGDLHLFDEQREDGVRQVITGGAAGLVVDRTGSDYHFTLVRVDEAEVAIEPRALNISQHPLLATLESIWFWIHSLFYVGHLNFILAVSVLIAVAVRLYGALFVQRDYYPDFDLDPEPWRNRSLDVAMLTNNYLPFIGGVPLSIERLRRGLQALGHRVLLLAPRYDSDEPDPADTVRIPTLLTLGRNHEFPIANILSPRLGRSLREFAPDLLHVHHPFWMGWIGLFHAWRLRIPVVYTYHTRLEHYAHYVPLPGPLFRNLISHSLTRRFANRCEVVIVPTESAEEYLRMIGVTSRIWVQPTGIDFDRFRRVEDDGEDLRQRHGIGDEKVLISVSRLSREKNIDFLLDGLILLGRSTPEPFRCLIIGEGEEQARLQERIDAAGMGEVITLVGPVAPDDIVRYYQLGDAFVFASRSETQGMVLLEAMAAGLPVVAIRSSGIDDLVNHRRPGTAESADEPVNGFKTRADPRQWADCIRRLLEEPELRERMSRAAVATAREHDIEAFARSVADAYALALALAADTPVRG
ncbi:MAG: glycosyltransferase [Gammaproteobacteria bacterium]|nr:glycosyltransferase [Gammaproteobacteria bacterium]